MDQFIDLSGVPDPGRLKCVWIPGANGRLECIWVPDWERAGEIPERSAGSAAA